MAYSFANKEAKCTVIQNDTEYTATVSAHHIIPKYVGIYLAPEFSGNVTGSTVCISDDNNECFVDDVTCFANNCNVVIEGGEISYDDTTPQVEVEVPENQVGDVTEYSFGYWFRF